MFKNLLGKMIGLDELLGVSVTDEQNEMISRVVRKLFFMFDDNADLIQFYHTFGIEGFRKLDYDCQRISDHESYLSAKVDELADLFDRQIDREIEVRKAYCDLKHEWGVALKVVCDQLEFFRRNCSISLFSKEDLFLCLQNLEDFVREAMLKEV